MYGFLPVASEGIRCEGTYLKSISSTFIELISTTNMLNFTTTGVPFFDGGRTSAMMSQRCVCVYVFERERTRETEIAFYLFG